VTARECGERSELRDRKQASKSISPSRMSASRSLALCIFLAISIPTIGWVVPASLSGLNWRYDILPGDKNSVMTGHGLWRSQKYRARSRLPLVQMERRKGMGSTLEERNLESVPTVKTNGIKVILAGKPCSGKGTQAPLIARKYRCVHISTGDLLRAEVRVGSELGETAEKFMKEGKLLPDDLVISIVKKRVSQDDCVHNGWILDGFPRTVGQARAMHDEGIDPDCVILLNRPDEMVIEWCEGRAFDPTTGIIYHPKFNPAPPEIEKFLVRRVDDTPHVIQQRLEQYHETFTEVIELYKGMVTEVNSSQHELDVFDDVSQVLDKFVPTKGFDVAPIRADRIRNRFLAPRSDDKPSVSYLDIIEYCNTHDISGYIPVTCGGAHIGFVGESLAAEMMILPSIGQKFTCALDSCNPLTGDFQSGLLDLAPFAKSQEERTEAVAILVEQMEERGLLRVETGNREHARSADDTLCPVFGYQNPDFKAEPILHMPQKTLPFFGTPLYGIHVNGIVEGFRSDGEDQMWISKRSQSKLAYPGLLDQMVSHHQGSRRRGENVWQPGITFLENAVRAAQREASVNANYLLQLRSASIVSYRYETAYGLETKVLFVYDLPLHEEWRPFNGDGEVDQFQLQRIRKVLRSFQKEPELWKPNAMLVGIDYAVRRGYITPDDADYPQIVSSLRIPPTIVDAPPPVHCRTPHENTIKILRESESVADSGSVSD